VNSLNYKRLTSITNSVTPYRGAANRFPLGNRKENQKYFLVGKEGGEPIFNIVYGYKYDRKLISKNEYDKLTSEGKSGLGITDNIHYLWHKVPDIVGRVRSDNSFQFTRDSYNQGHNHFLEQFSAGYFSSDSRRGGLIYSERGSSYMLPIYKGMRVDCETMRPLEPLVITGKRVDRKSSKELMSRFKDFFTISETMSKVMNMESFLETAITVYHEYGGGGLKEDEILMKTADTLIRDKPLDAMFLYMIVFNAGRVGVYVHSDGRWSRPESIDTAYTAMKRRLVKHLYETNKSIFKDVEFKLGEQLPSSEWSYKLTVNGKEVIQYGA
jgi:hypothetical protein